MFHHLAPSPVLPNGMMCELGEHTEGKEAQADNEHQQRDEECLQVAATKQGWIRKIAYRHHFVQVAQVVQQFLYRCIALLRVATDRMHYNSSQRSRECRSELEDIRRVV